MSDQADKPGKQHVLIAANPKSGASESSNKVAKLAAAVEAVGFQCKILGDLEEVRVQSHDLAEAHLLRAVVSAGGDGTADALANLLSPSIPICIFPLGTENLLAKHFGFTDDIASTCKLLQFGVPQKMDVGKANDKVFLVMASCGFDAVVVEEMDAIRKGHINRWSYAKPILNALRRYRFPQLQIRGEDDSGTLVEDSAAWIFVFNVPRYAANLDFCPQADPHDGYLDVCTFRRSGLIYGSGYFSRLFLRSHQSMKGFKHRRMKNLEVTLPSDSLQPAEIPFQIDGDPGGLLPASISVLPEHLTLLVPDE